MFILFFPPVNWLTSGFVCATLSAKNLTNKRKTQMLDKERCIKQQVYFEVFYISCIFKSPAKFSKCFLSVKFRTKIEVVQQKQFLPAVVANHSKFDFSVLYRKLSGI